MTTRAPSAAPTSYGSAAVARLRDELRRAVELRDEFDSEVFMGVDFDEPEGSPASRRVDYCVDRSIRLDHDIRRLERQLRSLYRVTGEGVMP